MDSGDKQLAAVLNEVDDMSCDRSLGVTETEVYQNRIGDTLLFTKLTIGARDGLRDYKELVSRGLWGKVWEEHELN